MTSFVDSLLLTRDFEPGIARRIVDPDAVDFTVRQPHRLRMDGNPGRRVARLRTALTIPAIEALEPADKAWIAWDDKVTGFGVRVQPSGAKSFIVNFRAGRGGPLKRMLIARVGEMLPGQARQRARAIIERAARGEDPEKAREDVLAVPDARRRLRGLHDRGRAPVAAHRPGVPLRHGALSRRLADLRPLDSIDAEDVKDRFERITDNHGWSPANRAISLLRSLYRKPCSDIESLHNPVSLWLDGGGRFHSKPRRKISSPSEVLPRWRAGIEAEVDNAAIRDALYFAYVHRPAPGRGADPELGTRPPGCTHIQGSACTGHPLRRIAGHRPSSPPSSTGAMRECGQPEPDRHAWVFPSQTSASGHLRETKHLYAPISETGGVKFWFQGMRNCYLAVAERELLLPPSLTSRLLNRAPVGGIAAGHPEDWTIEQLREPAQPHRQQDRGANECRVRRISVR